MNTKTRNTATKMGVFAAIASSLCCVTPLIALIAGIGGFASSFSWIGPARPFLIVLSFIFLGIAWIGQFRKVSCDCDETRWQRFKSSKSFLLIVTIFALAFTSFPLYSNKFLNENNGNAVTLNNMEPLSLGVSGMTCEGCQLLLDKTLLKQVGIQHAQSDYKKGFAQIAFDPFIISPDSIIKIIDKTGYRAVIIKGNDYVKEQNN